jgi:FkbM family methyltransferase
MRQVRSLAAAAVSRSMAVLPIGLLKKMELAAQLGQGKGWGTETVTKEVAAALELLGTPPTPFIVADVGANVGLWTEALLQLMPTAEVHCFEPSSTSYSHLAARHGADPRVVLHRCALGAAPGTATLWSDSPGSVLSSLERRDLVHRGLEFDHQEMVEVQTLDGVFTHRPAPALLKIDVEGRELDVLAGAEHLLRDVRVVQFEFGGCNIDTRSFARDFWQFFQDRGYELFRLTPRGPRKWSSYSEQDEIFITTNFIARLR